MLGFRLKSYLLSNTVGVGTFGKVKLAIHEKTQTRCAVKIINKQKTISYELFDKLRREINIFQSQPSHPHLIRLFELIDSPTDVFVVMEFAEGGELFDYIVNKGQLSEVEARRLFQQLVSGVEFCHTHRVCHRDLKPENLLLDKNSNLKIGDFGLSNFMPDGEFLKTSCGSPNYASPEVVSGKPYAGPEVDVWSCGVILYALLCGCLPFDDEVVANLFKKIRSGSFTIPAFVSEGARHLLLKMLVVDVSKRIRLKEVRRHPWFRIHLPFYLSVGCQSSFQDEPETLDPLIVERLSSMGYDVAQLSVKSLAPSDKCHPAAVAYNLLRYRASKSGAVLSAGQPFVCSREQQNKTVAAQVFRADAMPCGMTCPFNPFRTRKTAADNADAEASKSPTDDNTACRMVTTEGSLRTCRWKLGLESLLDAPTIMTGILTTLRALRYEWFLITPYKLRCRPQSADRQLLKWSAHLLPAKQEFCDFLEKPPLVVDSLFSHHRHRDNSDVLLTIQVFRIAPARYLVDLRIYDGSIVRAMSEALWITSAIHTTLTRVRSTA